MAYAARMRPEPIDYMRPVDYERAMYEYEHRLRDAFEQMHRTNNLYYKFMLDGYVYMVDRYGSVQKERDHHSYTNNYAINQLYGLKVFTSQHAPGAIIRIDTGYIEPKKEESEKKPDRSAKYRKLYWSKFIREGKRPI